MKAEITHNNGKYKLRYIQIPYDNRYFIISVRDRYNKMVDIAKVPCTLKNYAIMMFRGLIYSTCGVSFSDALEFTDLCRRIENFENRVDKKDRLLDDFKD